MAEQQPQLRGSRVPSTGVTSHCQHSPDTNIHQRDEEGVGLATPALQQAQQEQDEADLGLQGPRKAA